MQGVRKRETERQREMRLASWQHLQQEEAKEPWQNMRFVGADRKAAQDACNAIMDGGMHAKSAASIDMATSDYLNAVFPVPEPAVSRPQAHIGGGRQAGQAPQLQASVPRPAALPAPQPPGGQPLDPQTAAALPRAIETLFSRHSIASLDNVREWLRDAPSAEAAKAAASAQRDTLHVAVVACPGILCMRDKYVKRRDGTSERYRNLLLDMLQHHETVKKAEIISTAKTRKIELSNSDYSNHMLKVMKELCESSGSNWSLKEGW